MTINAIKHIVRVPADHNIMIKVPENVKENQTVEVILLISGRGECARKASIAEAVKDSMYLEDLNNAMNDFKFADEEGWD